MLRLFVVVVLVAVTLAWVSFYIYGIEQPFSFRFRRKPEVPVAKISCADWRQKEVSSNLTDFDIWYSEHSDRWLNAFVVPEENLIFCQIQKVDSADWFAVLRWLNQGQNLTTLRDYERGEALRMMFDPNWTKLAVVRDPLDRLLAAFSTKVNTEKPPNKNITAEVARVLNVPWHRLRKRKVTFPEFVVRVAAGIRERLVVSDFWRKQAEFCSLGHFKKTYQYVMYMDRRKEFHPYLHDCALLAMTGQMSHSKLKKLEKVAADRRVQPSSGKKLKEYDEVACEVALHLYAEDYETFSLPKPTCHSESPHVRYPPFKLGMY
ncbi:unnamed protein product [Durusdinium trenchii]|uniref:Uncharacterized protein n=2 Tax=Durusdinium trenchii TaxID=1381693 RepID=A0ABP0P8H2_9DINO